MKRRSRQVALATAGAALLLLAAAGAALADGGPHQMSVNNGTSGINGDCASCHRAHTAQSDMLLTKSNTDDLCLSCHGQVAFGASTDVEDGVQYNVLNADGSDATKVIGSDPELGAPILYGLSPMGERVLAFYAAAAGSFGMNESPIFALVDVASGGNELSILVDDEDDLGVRVTNQTVYDRLDLIELLLVHHHLGIDHPNPPQTTLRRRPLTRLATDQPCLRTSTTGDKDRFYPMRAMLSKCSDGIGSRSRPRGPVLARFVDFHKSTNHRLRCRVRRNDFMIDFASQGAFR